VNLALQVNGQLDANDKYGTQAAFNLQLDSLAYVENDSTLLQAAAALQGSWQRSVLDVQSNLWLTIPDLGNFDALKLNFRGEPQFVLLDLQGGDAEVRLQADCALEELQAVADKVMHELDMQTTRQAFDINALQQTIPTLQLEVDMAQQNPIMPLLQRYGVKFDQAKVLLTNADSLHLDLNIDTLLVEEHRLAHVDAHLVPKWGNYDYLAHVVYNDTLTGLDYALQLQARLQSDLIAARGNLWADTLQVISFGANLTQRIDASARLERLPLSMVNPFLPENIRLEGALMGQAVWQCDSVDFDALRAAVWFDSAHVWYEGCDLTLGLPSDSIVYQGGQVLFNSVRFPTASKTC